VPVAVIDKGLPGPGLLAQIVASKYADHLPLHPLERILGRHGIELSRSTMCAWVAHVAALFRPVVDLMANEVRLSRMLKTDRVDGRVGLQRQHAGADHPGQPHAVGFDDPDAQVLIDADLVFSEPANRLIGPMQQRFARSMSGCQSRTIDQEGDKSLSTF
jgi:hypothetical protein